MRDLSANVRREAKAGAQKTDTGLQHTDPKSLIRKQPVTIQMGNGGHVYGDLSGLLRRGMNLRRDTNRESIRKFASMLSNLDRSSAMTVAPGETHHTAI